MNRRKWFRAAAGLAAVPGVMITSTVEPELPKKPKVYGIPDAVCGVCGWQMRTAYTTIQDSITAWCVNSHGCSEFDKKKLITLFEFKTQEVKEDA